MSLKTLNGCPKVYDILACKFVENNLGVISYIKVLWDFIAGFN